MPALPRVVIVGGGFAGLHAALRLAGQPVDVTLVDRTNHHLFQPLLYQVATAALSPGDIAQPIRSIVRRAANIRVLLASCRSVDLSHRRIDIGDTWLPYDYLILAAGARHSYFGHDAWAQLAPGLKTLEDALLIRSRILYAYEAAERETDPRRQEWWLSFAVVGGGPTGVELAGAIAEIARLTLRQDFRGIDPRATRVYLIEAGPRILPAFPPELSVRAQQALERLGVTVLTSAPVTEVTAAGVRAGGTFLPTASTFWAAGVEASPLARSLGVPLDRQGRVLVEADLSVPGHPEVICAGDIACVRDSRLGVLPAVAPVAIQEGRWAAENILRQVRGLPTRPFVYHHRGNLATIGRKAAVADFGRVHLAGTVAWVAWMLVHILHLVGFENRLVVLLRWTWNYFTYQRDARLIVGEVVPPPAAALRRELG